MTLFPFDELNTLKSRIEGDKAADEEEFKKRKDYYIDEVTDLFVMAYVFGTQEVSGELKTAVTPDMEEMRSVIEEKFDGKDYKDRLNEYFASGTDYDIARVLDTDVHRIYNAAKYNGAKRGGATFKTWRTMLDPKVREAHDYLEGVKVGIDDEFYTYTGDSAQYPGGFGVPELDINCRCYLIYSKE